MRWSRERGRGLAIGLAVVIAAALAFRAARLGAGYWTIDDAGITYAASFELADHGSVAAYPEGPAVESYSNPLVYFVVAGLRVLGLFDPVVTPLRLEMLLFGGMTALVWAMLRRRTGELAALAGAALFAASQLTATPTWIWYGSGLENVWVATGLIAMLWLCVRTSQGTALAPGWGAVGFLAAITRPEAPVYVAAFYAALVLFARPAGTALRAHVRRCAGALAVTAVLYAGFLAWRRLAYGDWLPNTYYAKISGEPDLLHNLRLSVWTNILLFARTWLAASAALVLLAVPGARRVGAILVVLLVAALALPITAGEDWGMGGGHRFATPFLAVAHAALAWLAAVCITGVRGQRAARIAGAIGLVAIAWLTWRLTASRVQRPRPKLNEITFGYIAAVQGAERWEHQLRVGRPYAVSMIPDAGGSLLVGAMQMIDNAYLADFVLAHMGRYFGNDPALLRQVNQLTHEERRPDLVDDATAIGVIDHRYVGTRYLAGPAHLLARRDLVEVAALPGDARLVLEAAGVRVYLSADSELVAAPGALVRCELFVAWDGPLDQLELRGAVAGGDRDAIALAPYQPGARGLERRALLLGAPAQPGSAAITLELVRGDQVLARSDAAAHSGVLAIDVGDNVAAETARILADASPVRAARKLAWLREQQRPRLGMTAFHRTLANLRVRDKLRGSLVGADVLALRDNARLAGLDALPPAIAAAEVALAQRLLAPCADVACAGRVVDELRRLGYLRLRDRVPGLAAQLSSPARTASTYAALVGVTLAVPSDLAAQRQLIVVRRLLPVYPPLPVLASEIAPLR